MGIFNSILKDIFKKRVKIAFGIFQDGIAIKIAQLVSVNGKIRIQRLEEIALSSPLYPEETSKLSDKPESREDEVDVSEISEYDDETSELPEISEYDETEDLKEVEETEEKEVLSGKDEIQELLGKYPLEKGKIALNANDEQISYYQFDSVFSTTKNLKKKLKSEILSKEELKSKNCELDYIVNPDNSILAFVHRGKFELLNTLQDINQRISKRKYFYNHIDTNEISLMNLLRINYDFLPEDHVLIVYVGVDYKVGIVTKDNNHINTFTIIVTDSEPEKIRDVIYSKIMLEYDASDIPVAQHIILAGDIATDEDVKFFKNKFGSVSSVSRLELNRLDIEDGGNGKNSPEKVAQYAIPIALAWKTLEFKNKDFFSTNLLPLKIIEEQKRFKIEWHGILVFVFLFCVAYTGINKHLEVKKEIASTQRLNYNLTVEINRNRDFIDNINKVKIEISNLEENVKKIEKLKGNKDQWHYILKMLSNSLSKNRISWIKHLEGEMNSFKISGFATRRKSIIAFSELFPDATVTKVSRNEIQDIPIWAFDISYPYPSAKEIVKESRPEIQQPKTVEVKFTSTIPSEVYNKIVQIYLSGDLEGAFKELQQFIKQYPKDPLVYSADYLIGECLFQMGEIPEAKARFEKTLEHGGALIPEALMMLGRCYSKEGNPSKAIYYWDQLTRDFPDNRLAKRAAAKIEIVRESSPVLQQPKTVEVKFTSTIPSEVYNRIVQTYLSGDLEGAFKELQQFIKQYPKDPLVYSADYLIGECLFQMGEIPEAKARFEKTLEHGGALIPEALMMLGRCYSKEGNPSKAIYYWDQLIRDFPDNRLAKRAAAKIEIVRESSPELQQPKAVEAGFTFATPLEDYNRIVQIYLSGDLEGAFKELQQFIKQYPKDPLVYSAYYLIGECLFQMGEIPEAKARFEKTLEHGGALIPEALMMLGRCYSKEGNPSKAIYCWDQLTRDFPDNRLAKRAAAKIEIVRESSPELQQPKAVEAGFTFATPLEDYNRIVQIYLSGDLEGAFKELQQFIKQYPNDPLVYNAYYLIGECLFQMGEIPEAKARFEKIIEQGGNLTHVWELIPKALMMLGRCYSEEDNPGKAIYYWDKLVKNFPKNRLAKRAVEEIKVVKNR